MRRVVLVLLASCSYEPTSLSAHDGGPGSDATPSDAADPDANAPDSPQLATITFIQGATTVSGGANQAMLALSQPIAAGDLCIVGIGTTGTVSNVTDNRGNPYTNASAADGMSVWVAPNLSANVSATVVVQFSGQTGFTAGAAVYRGLAPASPVDGVASNGGQGAALDSGTMSTTHPHDLLVGIVGSSGPTTAAGGFTRHVFGGNSMIEDGEAMATGSYKALATAGSSQNWAIAIVGLKAAD